MDKDFVTIVSGLPRSGTSMMIQALEAGGIPALTDNIRKQDEDNPKGYYEFEPVKKTKQDPSWVETAGGKVVKVIYKLLYDLPENYEYRVVFMQRNLDEVLASQKKMLERSGNPGAGVDDQKMAELFRAQLAKFDQWVAAHKNFSILPVNHKDMITSPEAECKKIGDFLGGILDVDAAAAVVDPSLYRNKANK
ncbi:MAG: sulfotransferase family protein [Proteobacteria bacterium]|nr:sulfotransferase family protein [Pseudomonadota bacterium]